jgi:hypothetical protein
VDQLGNRADPQLFHELTTMLFDGLFRRAQFSANLLVDLTGDDKAQNLPLARRQLIQPGLRHPFFLMQKKKVPGAKEAGFHGPKKLGIFQRPGEKIDGARFERLSTHGDIALGRDKNDLFGSAVFRKDILKIKPAESRHAGVQHEAARAFVNFPVQE